MSMRRGTYLRSPSGRLVGPSEEPALERAEQLPAKERPGVGRTAVSLEHAHVVLEHVVRVLQRIVELVALEDVLVRARLVGVAQVGVHGTAHGPDGAGLSLDPDDDPLFVSRVVDTRQIALAKRPAFELRRIGQEYDLVTRLSDLFRNVFSFLSVRSSKEERVAAYVIREHERGRSLEEILADPYVRNRLQPHQISRLLDRPDVIRAIGDDTVAAARQTVPSG